MNKLLIYLLSLTITVPLFGCQNSNKNNLEIDDKSYINDFELVQINSSNDTKVKITSPKAIIDPSTNDIEIFDSTIEVLNKDNTKDNIKITSGKSILDNSSSLIRIFNNVNISLLESADSSITTNSIDWDLGSSFMNFNNKLYINFKNTKIISSSGSYNFDSDNLILNDNLFNRSIYNSDGKKNYEVVIISDIARWAKKDKSLEFISIDKQVETTINFLSIK